MVSLDLITKDHYLYQRLEQLYNQKHLNYYVKGNEGQKD